MNSKFVAEISFPIKATETIVPENQFFRNEIIVVYSPKRKKWVTGTQQKEVQKSNTEMKMALGVAVTKPNYRHLFLKCNAQY